MGLRSTVLGWLHGDDLRAATPLNSPALGSIAGGPPPAQAVPKPGTPPDQFKVGRGRDSRPTTTTILGSLAWLPRQQTLSSLDTLDLTRFTPEQIVEVLSNSSPELAMAAWNYVRLANSGYSISVKKPDRVTDDPTGYELAMDFLSRVHTGVGQGGMDTLIDSLHLVAYLEGAMCAEAPPLSGLTGVEDIYPVRPASIRFRWFNMGTPEDPRFQLAMQQWVLSMHQPIYLNPAQTIYVALDPYIDDPYGRPPAHAAIGAILFWLDILRDLRRALHMSAWGRLDVTVLTEALKAAAPDDVKEDEIALRNFINKAISDIQTAYAGMEPDDSLIHLDTVQVKAVDATGKVLQLEPIMRAIETLIIRGLKQLPTMMGGVSSRGAGQLGPLEYQITTAGVMAIQRMSSRLVKFATELHLRLSGHPGWVSFEYDAIRTTDRLKDAQAQALEIQNAARQRDEGFIDQHEAAILVTGHGEAAPDRIRGGPMLSSSDRPSPPPLPTNDQNPMDATNPAAKQPSVGDTTGEPGDQVGAPQPAPSRVDAEIDQLLGGLTLAGGR